MELESTFYIIGIICMSLITLILIALIAVAVAVKVKIDHIHAAIESKIQPAKDIVDMAKSVARKAKDTFGK